jgi:hypothetical protein
MDHRLLYRNILRIYIQLKSVEHPLCLSHLMDHQTVYETFSDISGEERREPPTVRFPFDGETIEHVCITLTFFPVSILFVQVRTHLESNVRVYSFTPMALTVFDRPCTDRFDHDRRQECQRGLPERQTAVEVSKALYSMLTCWRFDPLACHPHLATHHVRQNMHGQCGGSVHHCCLRCSSDAKNPCDVLVDPMSAVCGYRP